jgi:hypothetical protein
MMEIRELLQQSQDSADGILECLQTGKLADPELVLLRAKIARLSSAVHVHDAHKL